MSLKIGVIGTPGRWSSERLADAVEAKTGFRCLIDLELSRSDLHGGKVLFENHNLMEFDALIIKKLGARYSPDLLERLEILRFLEGKGVKIFSSPDSIGQAIDRLGCTIRLQLGNIPIPPTQITEDPDEAHRALTEYEKAIFKPLYTSKARGMEVITADHTAMSRIRRFKASGNTIMYIQKMVPIPGRDLGIVFLGGEYLGSYARVSGDGAWNTTTNSGGHYEKADPEKSVVEIAKKAQDLFNLDFTSVDVVETPDGPLVFEVSAFGGFRGLKDTHKIDAATLFVEHVLKKLG